MITLQHDTVLIKTRSLHVTIERGFITSLTTLATGQVLIEPHVAPAGVALQLVYVNEDIVVFDPEKSLTITYHQRSPWVVEMRVHGWDADAILLISECQQTGDLLIEPSAYSSRPGLLAVRWNVTDIPATYNLVAPFFQGVCLKLADELIHNTHWNWPYLWEAGLVILQGGDAGFWIHTQDTRYRYKSLKVGTAEATQCLGFDSEAYGPVDQNLAAGGITWRVNVYTGDWHVPATCYRQWLWEAYGLEHRAQNRASWLPDITFAVGWCDSNPALLDALAKQLQPERTIIHLINWRSDPYDINYPSYRPTALGKAYMEKGAAMGFHILPHCNAIDMDPLHILYPYVQDFICRDIRNKRAYGWASGPGATVPNSHATLHENRARHVMLKIHPGLAMWRSMLCEEIHAMLSEVKLTNVFTDVTLWSLNLYQSMVENQTSSEGMLRLIDELAALDQGMTIGGEGLNEITMQGLSIAQVHLFYSYSDTRAGLARTAGCPLNAFLFDGLCRTMGYSRLTGINDEEQLRSQVHLSLGAIPTMTNPTVQTILQPNPTLRALFEMAQVSGSSQVGKYIP